MPRMAYQPYSKKTARKPGAPLRNMLAGKPQHRPNPMDPTRELQKAKRPDPLAGAKHTDASGMTPTLQAGPLRNAVTAPNTARGTGSTRKPRRGSKLSSGSLRDAVAETTIGKRKNLTSNARAGQTFREFVRSDMPGYKFHEYTDPKTGKKKLIRVQIGQQNVKTP